jgi:hypothetical protein
VDPEKASIARQQPVNMFAQQPKHTPASTTPRASLSGSLLNASLNNEGILGSSVLFVMCSESI